MAATTNGTSATNGVSPKITLYTNHGCPWAHRAHTTLKELNLPYEEVIIDLGRPREEWYLKINPRGLVPSIKFSNGLLKDEIITESAIVSQFLADSFPNPAFFPASHSSPTAPLTRARIAFFVDAWFSKVQPLLMAALQVTEENQREEKAGLIIAAIKKEIEPLLEDANPFFGGSEKMTLAEALTGSFLLRLKAFGKGGLIHESLVKGLATTPKFQKWADTVTSQESVTYIWDEEKVVAHFKERIEKARSGAK